MYTRKAGGFITVLASDDAIDPDTTQDYTIRFRRGIDLTSGDRWEVALIALNCWFSFYNIDSSNYSNNLLRYWNGAAYKVITIPDGNYTADQLIAEITALITAESDTAANIDIVPNYSTGKFEVTFAGGYKLDFTGYNIRTIFGANSAEYSVSGSLPNIADITYGVNSLLVHMDVLDGSINGTNGSQVIATFVPAAPPSAPIEIKPYFPNHCLVKKIDYVESIRVWITDQQLRPVDLNGEPVSLTLQWSPLKKD